MLGSILKEFPEGYKRRVTVASVDVNTGDFIEFDQTNTDFKDMNTRATASGSIPMSFAPQLIEGMVMMDGGTDHDVNLISAV